MEGSEGPRSEATLLASEERFRELFATVSDAVMLFDPETKEFLAVNQAALELYGYTREEFLKLRQSDITAEPAASARTINEVVAGRVRRIPLRWHKKKGGMVFPAEISAGVFQENGRTVVCGVVRDITERKRTEEALRAERRQLQVILDGSPAYIFCKDARGVMAFVNKAFADMNGIPQEQWTGKTDFDLYSRELAERYHRDDMEVISTGRPKTNIIEPTESPGGERWLRTDKIPLRDDQGAVTGLIGFAVDITDLIQTEQALRQSEHKYRELAETASDIPYSMTAEGVVTYIGPQVARYGFGQGDFVGEDFRKFVLPGDRDYMTEELQRFVATGEALLSEFRFRAADGQIRWLQAHGTLYRDPAGRAVATSGLLREITERKELEWTLAELSAQERRRFGQDLHDGLGQELTGLACLAACLQKSVRTKGSPSPEIVDKLADRIQHAIDSMRRIAKGLLPVEIDELGLVVALEQLAEGWTHSCRIPCYFRCPEPVVVEDNTIATELFRIAQEALNNAAKHSQAHQVELELAKLADSISLTVRDDGVGLPDTLSHVAGMGLRIMRYRAGLIGATLHIRSCSGAGTEILCTVPTGHNPLSPS